MKCLVSGKTGAEAIRQFFRARFYHNTKICLSAQATNTVVHILETREYTGCLVNFKTEKSSYKTKHSVENPVEKQAIFENHRYICGSYKKRTIDCMAHFIRTDLLTASVTDNLRKVTSYAAKHEARFMKLLIEQNEDGASAGTPQRKRS